MNKTFKRLFALILVLGLGLVLVSCNKGGSDLPSDTAPTETEPSEVTEPAGHIDLVVHYQNWDGEYETLGSHGWDGAEARETYDGEDDFGIYFEFKDVEVGKVVGFIAVHWENGAQNWDKKETGDINIDTSGMAADQTHHVYVFYGAETKDNQPAYFVAQNDKYNMLLVYADPSGAYDEGLGAHIWNHGDLLISNWASFNTDEFGDVKPQQVGGWGSPTEIFTNGATHSAVGNIKVAMLSTDNEDLGMLIYAGDDPNKKTGDVTLKMSFGEEDPAIGEVGVIYVYSKGNAYTANDNVGIDKDVFVAEAFAFKLLPIGRDESGLLTGTYAPRAHQLRVQLSAQVALPTVDEEGEDLTSEEIADLVKTWFTIKEVTKEEVSGEVVYTDVKELVIDEVQFKPGEAALDFVVILDEDVENNIFDIEKDYIIEFDLGLDENENKVGMLEIDLDREAPVVSWINLDFILADTPDERIVLVEWDELFDGTLFPGFMVTDNRDGDITSLVYVPEDSEFRFLDTNRKGDYKILLRIEDEWGNVTEETFIFRVVEGAEANA